MILRTLIETLQCYMTLTVQLQSSTDAWLLGLEFTASNCLFLREGGSPITGVISHHWSDWSPTTPTFTWSPPFKSSDKSPKSTFVVADLMDWWPGGQCLCLSRSWRQESLPTTYSTLFYISFAHGLV